MFINIHCLSRFLWETTNHFVLKYSTHACVKRAAYWRKKPHEGTDAKLGNVQSSDYQQESNELVLCPPEGQSNNFVTKQQWSQTEEHYGITAESPPVLWPIGHSFTFCIFYFISSKTNALLIDMRRRKMLKCSILFLMAFNTRQLFCRLIWHLILKRHSNISRK